MNIEIEKRPKLPPVPIVHALNAVRGGINKVGQKMVPPPVAVLEMISGMWIAQAVGVAAKIGVADHIPPQGARVEDLAAQTGSHAPSLYRLLRALTVSGLFEEGEERRFKLTPVGACLRTDHPQSMRYMAIFQSDLNWPHWQRLDHSIKTGENTVPLVRGMSPFEYLSKNPKEAEIFDNAMVGVSRMEVDSILAVYDFSEFHTLADVGGGYGAFLSSILHINPKVKGILFDMPHVGPGAQAFIEKQRLSHRTKIMTGSFFEAAPENADGYLLKHIIHDWSDEQALRILNQIRAVIPAQGTLLIFETVVPGPHAKDFSKYLDLEMLVVTDGGKERTKEDFQRLLAKAGFRIDRFIPTISMATIIEASPS